MNLTLENWREILGGFYIECGYSTQREVVEAFIEGCLYAQRQATIAEKDKEALDFALQVVLPDSIMEVNATPEIGERVDFNKLNYANQMLNKLNNYILQRFKSKYSPSPESKETQ